MGLYYPGYHKAHTDALKMDESELLGILDSLYGRSSLPYNYSLSELRDEALRQLKDEFTDKSSREYSLVKFYTSPAWKNYVTQTAA